MADRVELLLTAKDQASAAVDQITASLKGMTGSVRGLGSTSAVLAGVTAAVTAVAAGAVTLAKGLSEQVESMHAVRAATGATTAEIQVLRQVFKTMGASAEAADNSLTRMALAIGRGEPVLKDLKVSSRNAYQALIEFSEGLKTVEDPGTRAFAMQRVLGKSFKESSLALEDLRTNTAAVTAEYAKFGGLLTDDVTGGADALDASLDRLSTRLDAVRTSLALKVTPTVIELIGTLTALGNVVKEVADLPPVKILVSTVFSGISLKEFNRDMEKLANNLRAINIYFKEGEQAAKDFARAAGLKGPFQGFSGGSSGGKGGGGDFGSPDTKRGKKGAEPPPGWEVVAYDSDGSPIWGIKPKAAKNRRENRIEDIRQSLHLAKADAESLLHTIEAIERTRAEKKTAQEIQATFGGGKNVEQLDEEARKAEVEKGPRGGPVPKPALPPVGPPIDLTDIQRQQQELLDRFPELSEVMIGVGIQWQEVTASVLDTSAMLSDALGALWNGLQVGFSQAFNNLVSGATNLKGALTSIFQSIVQEILAMLARLVAAKVFQAILGFILGAATGGPAGAVAGTVVGSAAAGPGGGTFGAPGGPVAPPPVGGGMTAGGPSGDFSMANQEDQDGGRNTAWQPEERSTAAQARPEPQEFQVEVKDTRDNRPQPERRLDVRMPEREPQDVNVVLDDRRRDARPLPERRDTRTPEQRLRQPQVLKVETPGMQRRPVPERRSLTLETLRVKVDQPQRKDRSTPEERRTNVDVNVDVEQPRPQRMPDMRRIQLQPMAMDPKRLQPLIPSSQGQRREEKPVPQVTNNFHVNVNALNARDVALSTMSPLGEMRRGLLDAAAGAY